MEDRRYRQEDLDDPVVFENIVLDRKKRFATRRVDPIPDDQELEEILYEGDIASEQAVKKKARFEDE